MIKLEVNSNKIKWILADTYITYTLLLQCKKATNNYKRGEEDYC